MATRITNSGQHRTLLTSVQIIFNYRAALSRFQLLNYVSRPQGGEWRGGQETIPQFYQIESSHLCM